MANNANSQLETAFINDGLSASTSIYMGDGKSKFLNVLKNLYHQIELLTDAFLEKCSRDQIKVDCKMGCGWCCNQSVFASTHEALYVVEYLKQKYSPAIISDVVNKAHAKSAKTREMTREQLLRNNLPCPLLQNNKCMVYTARPMACRIYLSADVNTCIDRYNNPADKNAKPALFKLTRDAGRYMNFGFVSGLKSKGLQSNEAPLEWLLSDLLEKENAFEEWLDGAVLNDAYKFE